MACSEQPIGVPAGDNNYDDPDDPGQNGQGNNGPDAAGDASGRFCVAARDCPANFVCAYSIATACGAAGACMPYIPTTQCSSSLACGCDGTTTALCAPDGFATKPVSSLGACEAGTSTDAGSDAATDAATDAAIDDSGDAASE